MSFILVICMSELSLAAQLEEMGEWCSVNSWFLRQLQSYQIQLLRAYRTQGCQRAPLWLNLFDSLACCFKTQQHRNSVELLLKTWTFMLLEHSCDKQLNPLQTSHLSYLKHVLQATLCLPSLSSNTDNSNENLSYSLLPMETYLYLCQLWVMS